MTRVVRQYIRLPGLFYETFFLYLDGGIARFCYSYLATKPWLNVGWLATTQDRVDQAISRFAEGGEIIDSYQYDVRGRLCLREREQGDAQYWSVIEHDDAGIIRVVQRQKNGAPQIAYERHLRGAHLTVSARPNIVNKLEDIISTGIRSASVEEELYAVAFHVTKADSKHLFPPRVALGRAAEREDFIRRYGQEAPDYIWSPYEWTLEAQLTIPPADMDLFRAVNANVWQSGSEARAYALTRALARRSFIKELPIRRTKDFVCFFVLWDLGDYPSQVARQLSKSTVEDLRRSGYL